MSHPTRRNGLTFAFFALQVGLLGCLAAWGVRRYESFRLDPTALPAFRNQPIQVRPTHDEPAIISDAQLERILWKLRPQLRAPQSKINYIDHALRMWGPEAQFDDPECLSGLEMLETLLDDRAFRRRGWSDETKPLLIAEDNGVAVRTQEGVATSSHVDHTLAGLGEIGVPLDYPVVTSTGETEVAALLEHALRDFRLNQIEYEWSALAFAEYLDRPTQWISREGQQINFDRIARRMMRQRLVQGVCRGNHRVHSLVMMLRIDEIQPLLSAEGRKEVTEYLQDLTRRLVASQHADGYWEKDWPGVEWDGPPSSEPSKLGVQTDRILVTGHVMEWWALAPDELLPPLEVRVKAGQWLVRTIDGLTPGELKASYTFLTHAGRALALWRGRLPAEVVSGAPGAEVTER